MGYDCTLHLIDEDLIGTDFVRRLLADGPPAGFLDRLLGRRPHYPPSAFDRRRRDAPQLWKRARRILRWTSGETAARAVAEFALLFNSCELPFEPARNVALSLWSHLHPDLEEALPEALLGSPDQVFAGLIQEYPQLRGEFPTHFDGNGSLGVYVPADKVPALARFVETRIGRLNQGDQQPLLGLVRVLKVAARNGYAYWEACEIEVMSSGSNLLETRISRPRDVQKHVVPLPGRVRRVCTTDEHVVLTDREWNHLALVGLASWPPGEVARTAGHALSAARAPRGEWAVFAARGADQYEVRLLSERLEPVRILPGSVSSYAYRVGWLGSRVLLHAEDVTPNLLLERDNEWQPAPELPLPAPAPYGWKGAMGTLRLQEGPEILIYDGHGYREGPSGLERTLTLDADTSHTQWSYVPSERGFYFLSGRRLYEAQRDGRIVRHLRGVDNIMRIAAGPPGWLLLKEGNNPYADVGKVYSPSDSQLFSVPLDLFVAGVSIDEITLDDLHWNASTECLLVGSAQVFWAVPWAKVVAQDPRNVRPLEASGLELAGDERVWPSLPPTYRDGVAHRIVGAWRREALAYKLDGEITIRFEIRPGGALGELETSKGSGDVATDRAALSALVASGPFRPLVAGASEGLRLAATFRRPRAC